MTNTEAGNAMKQPVTSIFIALFFVSVQGDDTAHCVGRWRHVGGTKHHGDDTALWVSQWRHEDAPLLSLVMLSHLVYARDIRMVTVTDAGDRVKLYAPG